MSDMKRVLADWRGPSVLRQNAHSLFMLTLIENRAGISERKNAVHLPLTQKPGKNSLSSRIDIAPARNSAIKSTTIAITWAPLTLSVKTVGSIAPKNATLITQSTIYSTTKKSIVARINTGMLSIVMLSGKTIEHASNNRAVSISVKMNI